MDAKQPGATIKNVEIEIVMTYYVCLQMIDRMTMNTAQIEPVTNRTRNPDISRYLS